MRYNELQGYPIVAGRKLRTCLRTTRLERRNDGVPMESSELDQRTCLACRHATRIDRERIQRNT